MINKGNFLTSPAMLSSEAATGTQRTMPVCSISTTTIRATRTTISASADPRNICASDEHAHEAPFLGRKFPEAPASKARHIAKPKTALEPIGTGVESGSDFHHLTSLPNLMQCWGKARKNKSNSIRVQRFGDDPLRHIVMIQRLLRAREYTFGPYKTFTVQEKKFRHVVDAPMKDRIVHWMLYRYLLSIWQPRFIADTFGNLPGRGTHAAVKRVADFCRKPSNKYALQMDISKYFYSVNHDLLKARALRYLGDQDLRQVIINLIDSFTTGSEFDDLFASGSMYRSTLAKGMPIGNLSSQLFANIYLSDFDHWVKETLRVKHFVRYVDDMIVLGSSPAQLHDIGAAIKEKLAADGLTIHPHKTRLAPVATGIPFLGYMIWPNHISAGAYVRSRFNRTLREHECQGVDNSAALASYSAMFKHTGSTIYRRGT